MSQNRRKELFRDLDQVKVIPPDSAIAPITNSFYSAVVINNDDPKGNKRIQARISSKDSKVADKDLKWCISLNPSGFFMLPLPGEHVIVFLRNPWNNNEGRFYMGPIRSSDSAEFESFNDSIKKLEIPKNGL